MIPNGRENTGYPAAYPEPYPEAYAPMNNSNRAFPSAFPPAFAEPFPGSNRNVPGWVPPRRRSTVFQTEETEYVNHNARRPIPQVGIYETVTTTTTTTTSVDGRTTSIPADDASVIADHIAQERERVRELRRQQQARSDTLLHEAVKNAVAEHLPENNMVTKPPGSRLTSILRFFLDARTFEAFLGDLYDRRALIAKRNQAKADRWFWYQLLTSIPALFGAQAKRSFGVNKLMEWFLKIRS